VFGIASQIGRAPRGDVSIVRTCPHGYPQVLRVSPWLDGAPFPTLYWLSCPFLVRAIAALEAEGWVARLEDRLGRDRELRAAFDCAQEEYVAERSRLAGQMQGLTTPNGRRLADLGGRGIGGIADRSRLKCLHLHTAHALAARNPIGDLVLGLLRRSACECGKAICPSLEREEQIADQPTER
jgi:hypothetical protein